MDKKQVIEALIGYSETPQLDVRFFFEDYPNATEVQIADFIRRRQAGEPVAKILGHCGFWDLDFIVSVDTLDPRPDSETMIESVLERYPDKNQSLNILDLGTGSGCLLLTLLKQYPKANGVGVDFSEKALEIAKKNAEKLQRPIRLLCRDFMQSDWTEGLDKFDIIVSNPPYIPTKDIDCLDKSTRFDPFSALDGGADGLNAYRALANSVDAILKKNGTIFFEIGQGQEQSVCETMQQAGFQFIKAYRDLGQIIRILVFKKN